MASQVLTQVTADTFDQEVLQSNVPVLVDFWAEWCTPCKMIAPTLEKIQQEKPQDIKIVQVNIDDFPQFSQQYDIRSIPNMKFFSGGKVTGEIIGAWPEPQFRAKLDELLSSK
jgi:thioredoxin